MTKTIMKQKMVLHKSVHMTIMVLKIENIIYHIPIMILKIALVWHSTNFVVGLNET